MLTEERQQLILQQLKQQGTVTVAELVAQLDTSESTIRRDLTVLSERGQLKKIHGGAMLEQGVATHIEYQMDCKQTMNQLEKQCIARYAARLIEDGDVIYLDAGTSTERMIDFIEAKDLVAVTNGIGHVKKLLQKGIQTVMIGGSVKAVTEAVIGVNAVAELDKYHFTKGFFGTNGVSGYKGYTTPDIEEAMVKQKAIQKSNEVYILADHTKINEVSFVRFAKIDEATLITDRQVDGKLHEQTTIIEVDSND
ncbi:MAG: DeoR/GlpR family DNA-binding transcription regulator [Cellulosilyticaceae bacterium]